MNQSMGKERDTITLTVNGISHELEVGERSFQVAPSHTLAHTLRETLKLTGTKVGCDQGGCGEFADLQSE